MAGDRALQISHDQSRVQDLRRQAQHLSDSFERTYDGKSDADRMLRLSAANVVCELDLLLALMDEELLSLHTANASE